MNNEDTLMCNSIRKAIADQRKLLAIHEKESKAVSDTFLIIIENLEEKLKLYSAPNPPLINNTPYPNVQVVNPIQQNSIDVNKEMTLGFIAINNPMYGSQIAAEYKKLGSPLGMSTIKIAVLNHLKELEEEGRIYKTNPQAERFVRYAIKVNLT